MATVKGEKKHPDSLQDYTLYHDTVMEICDGVDDDNSQMVSKIIEQSYNVGKSFDQAAKAVNDVTLATTVEIYLPTRDNSLRFREKNSGIDKIVNESFNSPRVSIYYDDGRSVSYVGLPFKITEYRSSEKPKTKTPTL